MKRGLVYIALIITLALTVVMSATVGAVHIPFVDILRSLFGRASLKTDRLILFTLRLPRIIEAGLVGMALSVVGVCFQGLLKNPMADPYVLGISSGAATGATIAIVLGLSMITMNLFAFVLALVTIFAVYILARKGSKVDMTSMLLAGIAISSFLSAVISFLMMVNHNDMSRIVFWTMGGFSYITWYQIIISAFIIMPGSAVIYAYSRELNAMLTGEESAYHLGIDVERVKRVLLVVGSFITASAVSVSGIIGFVGLIIPHIVRIVVGPDHKTLIPISALVGAIFLILADTLSRVVLAPMEIPVGIVTAAVGGPYFLYLLAKSRRRS